MKRLGEPEFWLLVFLAVLLAQSALGLFFPAPEAAGGIAMIKASPRMLPLTGKPRYMLT